MAQQNVGVGTTANDGTGDPLRTAGGKINANFTELYARPAGAANLDALTDVAVTSPTSGQVLRHNGTQFVNAQVGPGDMGISGSASSSTFLRGDNTWGVPVVSGSAANFRTPSNSGFTVTKDGTGDNTTALNGFFALLGSTGDCGWLEPGIYRTTAELYVPPGHAGIRGPGWRKCIIKPAGNTYHGIRMKGSFSQSDHGMQIGGFSVISSDTTFPPVQTGKAAFILDNCPQAQVFDIMTDHYDIGFDGINNSYNALWDSLRNNRSIANVNCGINIREGNHSGSDWIMRDMHLCGHKTACCIAGSGGGYRFQGFSMGKTAFYPENAYGVITLGWDYATNTEFTGMGSLMFDGGHIEGWRNSWAFRCYGSLDFSARGLGFVPSASEIGQRALGLYKHTGAGSSNTTWIGNSCGSGYSNSNVVCDIQGQAGGFYMTEMGWTSGGLTWAGGSYFGSWLLSLMDRSNLGGTNDQRGWSVFDDTSTWSSVMAFGKLWLRPDNVAGTIQVSTNRGTSWTTL